MAEGETNLFAPRARWADYERQLYDTAISDPSRYEEILTTVRTLADRLRHIEALEELDAAWPRASEIGDAAISSPALRFPNEQLFGAAFAIREREIRALNARCSSRKCIEGARGTGHRWVMLDEAGNMDSGLRAPYRSTEMHLETGLAVVSMVQPDPSDGTAVFVVGVVKLDPLSGELVDPAPGIEDWMEYKVREEYLTSRAALRTRIDAASD